VDDVVLADVFGAVSDGGYSGYKWVGEGGRRGLGLCRGLWL
jgi:hypothetical protein